MRAVADLDRILSTIEPLAARAGLIVRERAFRGERRARMQPLPDALDARVRAAITAGLPGGVYVHQADAVAAGLGGEDVGSSAACCATGSWRRAKLAQGEALAELTRLSQEMGLYGDPPVKREDG
jgi:hypothetical protein